MTTDHLQTQRFYLRKSLWKNHHRVSAQDSFDRVKVLSPSLVDCLLQRTTQDREVYLYRDRAVHQKTEALEKMTFCLYSEKINLNYIRAVQPYLRSSMIYKSIVHLFMQHSSQPRLRSINIYDDFESQVLKSKVFHKFGPQLRAFTYNGILPFVFITGVNTMSRLQKLKIELCQQPAVRMVQPNVERIILWHQLSVFSLRCQYTRHILECAQLFEQLGQMTQLRKLSIELSFNRIWEKDYETEEIKQFLTAKLGAIPKFSKLEVLRFYFNSNDYNEEEEEIIITVDYRFLVDLLVPKLGATLTKLIFRMPSNFLSTSDCIFLDYFNEFPHLQTLVLGYRQVSSEFKLPNLYDPEDKRTPSQSILHLTIANFTRYDFCYNEIFTQIPAIFPNLVELNFKLHSFEYADDCVCRDNANLTDRYLMDMINRLPRLCTLRFADDCPKFRQLLGSIELMCKRAAELKPKVPMLFRVPLGDELEYLKYCTDQLPDELKHNFYWWQKAAKWIRLC